MGNYIRMHRNKSGLNQRELGEILGNANSGVVSRHERSHSLPPLLMALAYEIVFCVPVSELFGGVRETVERAVENRLTELRTTLQKAQQTKNDASIEHKLAWLSRRLAETR